MIWFLIFTSLIYLPLCLADCNNTKTFGTSCQYHCTNCSIGCHVNGACINSSCLLGFYGTGCRENNTAIVVSPIVLPSNCSVSITTSPYSGSSSIGPSTYHVVYGPNSTTPYSQDYTKWPSRATLTNLKTNVWIGGETHIFGIYFDFINILYADSIQSLVSPSATATCNSSSNLPTTPSTSPSTTTTSPSTPSTPYTGTTFSTLSTSTKPIISPGIVQNFRYSNTPSSIYVTWTPPQNVAGLVNYKVTSQPNNAIIITNTSTFNANLSGLSAGSVYVVTISSIYSSNNPVDFVNYICTSPAPDIQVDPVQIKSVDRKSINVVFPIDRTNYTCSTNIYRLATLQTNTLNRRKRAASPSTSFPVGAIVQYNGTNVPTVITINNLNSATNYTIYTEISTNINGTLTYYYSTTLQQTNGPSDGVIAGIIIGILLFLILIGIIIFLIIFYKKRKQKPLINMYLNNYSYPLKDVVFENKPRSFAYWSPIADKMEARYLQLNQNEWTDDLLRMETMSFTNQNYSDEGLRFIDEFSSLPEDSPYTHMDAEINYLKNKKQDIFPYDHNRVKLRRTSTDKQSDYINASFIDGYLRKKAYIAAQSPFDEETINDFWSMIYQQNVGQIIMLTEVEHGNVTKSSVYWPQTYNSKHVTYGNISVKIIYENSYAFYDIRKFEIKEIDSKVESQLVTQYQFRGWPHNEIPENSIAFLDFYLAIKVDANISNGPLLVHCGTGISQSAVYIAFDILNQQVTHENCVNVFRTVAQLRRARSKMVRNSKQYMFIYDLLFESLLCGQFIINTNVRKIYKLLHKVNPQSGREYMYEQFCLLQTYHKITSCHSPNTKDISFVDSIDQCQNLSSICSPMNDFGKIEIFWNTVLNNKIEVIIDLRTTDERPYYILDNIPNLEVFINEISIINESVRRFDISLYNIRNEKEVKISIYQLGTSWVDNEDITCEPPRSECEIWVELIYHLLINHPQDRIMAHCVNGWSKSGLFLTCFNIAMKMLLSKYVMVYNVVKSMKFYRYEFVTSFAQFQFIYTFLKKWVDTKMVNGESDDEYLSGLLPSGDKLHESLFTHEQTPVLGPDQKQIFAPSLQSLGSREFGYENNDDFQVVHYHVNTSLDLTV